MRCQVLNLEGDCEILCVQCRRRKRIIYCRPLFTRDEALVNDVLTFCRSRCYDLYYLNNPIKILERKEV